MPVDEPFDVLAELVEMSRGYAGTLQWLPKNGTYSNPVKLLNESLVTAQPHPSPRKNLSGRSGAALLYALARQGVGAQANANFSRVFRHVDGRELMLENGVTSDLLALGAIRPADDGVIHHYTLTGLGSEQLRLSFPGQVR